LFQLAILAEKELQGRQQQFQPNKNTFMPKTFTPPAARTSSAVPSASTRSPSTTTPSDGKPRLQDQSKGVPSSGRSSSSSIQCHCCQGFGHVFKDCPSKRTYIATDDGGYISTSDVEDDIEDEPSSREGLSLSSGDAGTQRNCIVNRVLGTQMEQVEKMQRHNLFQILFVIQDRRACVIIDGGSCNNLVSADLVKQLGLSMRPHKHSYYVQWLNDSGKVKVTQTARVHFFLVHILILRIVMWYPWKLVSFAGLSMGI
jgi:hypothetical protein